MSWAGDLSGLPPHVLKRLGTAPEDLGRFGSSRVLRGDGVLLKQGPADRTAREAFLLAEGRGLPLTVPAVFDAGEGWLLLDEVENSGAASGSVRDDALADLARLHEDSAGHTILRDSRLRDVTGRELPGLRAQSMRLAHELGLPEPLRMLVRNPQSLLERLSGPSTLVHGDAWPGNVLETPGGGRCWIDWEEAGVGHAALDLANWCHGSPWVPPSTAPDRDIDTYVAARRTPLDAREFRLAVDSAVVLLFLLLDLPGLADAAGDDARGFIEQRAETARRLVQPTR